MIRRAASLLPLILVAACSRASADSQETNEAPFSSDQATLLDFEFDGELVTDSAWGTDKSIIQDQLLYTMGHLNWDKSVGRLDKVTLSGVERITEEGGRTRIRYHAKLPVAWGSKTRLPTSYAFKLPTDISYGARDVHREVQPRVRRLRRTRRRPRHGVYEFAMTGTGDADLYVKQGAEATSSTWDCRPYKNGSSENCTLTLDAAADVSVMVRGYAASSTFTVTGTKR